MGTAFKICLAYIFVKNLQAKGNGPKVHYVNWLPAPRRAMTIPPFGIYIKKEYAGNEALLNHEYCHWQQYQQRGLLPFYLDYGSQFFSHGYDNMPMELTCGPKV